jgi:hypothetical protein
MVTILNAKFSGPEVPALPTNSMPNTHDAQLAPNYLAALRLPSDPSHPTIHGNAGSTPFNCCPIITLPVLAPARLIAPGPELKCRISPQHTHAAVGRPLQGWLHSGRASYLPFTVLPCCLTAPLLPPNSHSATLGSVGNTSFNCCPIITLPVLAPARFRAPGPSCSAA